MIPRERNALLAPLTACGLRRIGRDPIFPTTTSTVEDRAREALARFLATLPCRSPSDLMRRSFPFVQLAPGAEPLGFLDE